MNSQERSSPWPTRLAVLFASLSAALLLACAYLVYVDRSLGLSGADAQAMLDNPLIRDRVIRELVNEAGGDWDSHNDPDVGRMMRPESNKKRAGIRFASNRLGLREKEFELPKPEGLIRVVLLGDSYIFGTGLEAESRVGCFLEEQLRDGAGDGGPPIEVLHYGLISWNYLSEAAYVRRQLSLLQPDLVIQLSCPNDLDDCYGVRGFGSMSRFTAQHRSRADALVQYRHPSVMMGIGSINYLSRGMDHESRQRYEAAAEASAKMIEAIGELGGEYLHVFRWEGPSQRPRRLLLPELSDERVFFLSSEFFLNPDYWVQPNDNHFNRAGMEIFSDLLYAVIQERGLLPMLELEPVERASQALRGMEQELGDEPYDEEKKLQNYFPIDDHLSFEPLTEEDAPHFNGGVDDQGRTSPYASLSFRPRGKETLHLRGRGLDRPEIRGLSIQVAIEGVPVGTIQPGIGEDFEQSWPLPHAARGRKLITVTLESDDYVYVGEDLQHCVSFHLREMGLR